LAPLLVLNGPVVAHLGKRPEAVAGRGLYPEASQQAGDHEIVFRRRRGPQLCSRPAPLQQQHRRLCQLVRLVDAYCPGSVPRPKAVSLVRGLRVRPADLEREVFARNIAGRGHPGGHAAGKKGVANLDLRVGGDPRDQDRQPGEPVVAPFAGSRPRQVIGDHEAFRHADHSRVRKAAACSLDSPRRTVRFARGPGTAMSTPRWSRRVGPGRLPCRTG
jgi:hypothetical protein